MTDVIALLRRSKTTNAFLVNEPKKPGGGGGGLAGIILRRQICQLLKEGTYHLRLPIVIEPCGWKFLRRQSLELSGVSCDMRFFLNANRLSLMIILYVLTLLTEQVHESGRACRASEVGRHRQHLPQVCVDSRRLAASVSYINHLCPHIGFAKAHSFSFLLSFSLSLFFLAGVPSESKFPLQTRHWTRL